MPTQHVRHVSVRVPWHDAEWNGHVCDDPLANSSCLALRLIAENRNDDIEQGIAKEAFDGLAPEQMPPCLRSSAAFLSPHSYTFKSVMEYSKWSRDHKHILPRAVHLPAFGALLIPYRWMLKDSGFEIAESLELDAHAEREPNKPLWLENTSWVQHLDNQRTLLDGFAKPLIKDETLVFFYAPRTPLCDDERRAILGVAFLETKSELVEYPYEGGSPRDRLQAIVWERPIQHSLRPRRKKGTGFSGGFVMPYHEVLKLAERDRTVDPAEFVAFVPNDVRMQFSYGSEQVSHGVAAAVLAASRHALEKIGSKLDGPWADYISWIDERLGRLWRLQGPAPGLGVTLSALHKGFNGTLFAIALAGVLGENEDPWPIVDSIFSGGQVAPAGAPKVTAALRRRWANVKSDPKRLASLKLLARFELTNDQAYRAVNETEHGRVLSNPYVLYEDDRKSLDSVSFATIDRGLYPGTEIADAHPLPTECDGSLEEPDNPLRLRAACVHILEEAAAQGDTLLPADRVKDACGELNLTRPLPLDAEMLDIFRQDFKPVVHVAGEKAKPTVQLERYGHYRELNEEAVKNRLRSKPKKVVVEWRASLDRKFGEARPDDVDELRARKEKEIALDRLAGNRIAALVGQAGTGKTTVLELLLQQHDVVGTRVHLLAPTGKARVRLAQETNRPGEGETIAQFLLALDRYDKVTGRYFPNPAAAKTEATTCIVDESSMMTEDMLAAIVDAIPDACRLILVGDPYQLPPIGAGCPFVDIIEFLRRSHAEAVGELTVPRRQDSTSTDGRRTAPLERSDVQLAAIFSGRALLPGEDEIAARILTSADDEFVKCRRWDQTADLPNLLKAIFKEEFGAKDDSLQSKFEQFLGAVRNQKGYLNFENGCSDGASGWQILCVTKTQPGGSIHLNRHVKETYRGERLKKAIESNHVAHYRDWFRFIKPRGPEQITYGDKVICVRNHFRNPWLYTEKTRGSEDEYIANGEIGMVVGQCNYGKSNPRFTNAEFSGRSDRSFSFSAGAFREEGQPYLELAYAITVHKAQGSDFDTVVLVLPAHSRLLSREMIYTALTRQKRRIWILHQGPFDAVLAYRHYSFSDIAARFTNLLREHRPQQVPIPVGLPSGLLPVSRGFLEERLVHRTIRGEMVSSKSELAIANILYSLEREGRLTYVVEPPLPFADNAKGRWADFQIRSQGQTWFWEHCGMMDDESYLRRWKRKEKLYKENGFTRYSEENLAGRLIVTEDGSGEGLDSHAIAVMARKLFVPVD